jgi:hypothetical protein
MTADVYTPRTRKKALAYLDFLPTAYDFQYPHDWPSLDDWPHLLPRQRKTSVTALIRQARRAGERGEVRVEILNHDGSRTIVTSSRDAASETLTEADAEQLWIERIGKHAH